MNTKCWEFFNCNKKKCPSYKSRDLRCWLQCGTFCHDSIQGTWLEKMEECIKCEVFKGNISPDDYAKTFSMVSEQFKSYREKIENERRILKETQKKLKEFKTTSIYLLRELDKRSGELLAEKSGLREKVEEKTRELQLAQTKLVQSAKMAAIGKFSAGIAHEINNPLGAIINYVRTVLANPEVKGQNRGNLEVALKGLFRIENIVKQILGYSRPQQTSYSRINVNQLLNDMLVFVQHKMNEKNIKPDFRTNGSSPEIYADPSQIHQLFINILNNAVDAAGNEGKIKIETLSAGSSAQIKISDNGTGIRESDLDKVCDPFFTTKEVGKGSGLGLFMCYNIIQLYQGSIDIKSKEGKGTTVTITLPAEPGAGVE